MKKEYFTYNSSQTKKLGEKLARQILKSKEKKGAKVFGLVGDLGGGKTTFLQGFAKGLGIKEKILSPTFVILKRFEIYLPAGDVPKGHNSRFKNFYHIDCYGTEKPKDFLALDFEKMVANPENIVALEWADKIRKIMPKETIWIDFEFIDEKTRKITVKATNKTLILHE